MQFYRWLIVIVALCAASTSTAAAQAADADALPIRTAVVKKPYRTAEVVGLRRWTVEMVQDSIDQQVPGMSLFKHACAASLRYELGFAEAASFIIENPGGQRGFRNIVLLIEPQDSALVRHRNLPRDVEGTAAPWDELVEYAREDRNIVWSAVRSRLMARAEGEAPRVPEVAQEHAEAVRAVWAYLDDHATEQAAEQAREILMTSPYLNDRVAATAILSSFPDDDATWRALAGGLLEADGPVRGFSGMVLSLFSESPRTVDWEPAAADVHAILNGSSLFELTKFMNVLLRTGVDTRLARPFLRDGGHGVLMQAMVEYPEMRDPALELLRALSGRDYGTDVEQWRSWVDSL